MSSDARTRAYYPALNALGLIIMIFGLLMSFPLIVSAVLGDGATLAYDQGLFVTFVAGLLLWAATRSKRRDLRVHDGFLLVAATWVTATSSQPSCPSGAIASSIFLGLVPIHWVTSTTL